MLADINDPRYSTDSAFRADVEQKLNYQTHYKNHLIRLEGVNMYSKKKKKPLTNKNFAKVFTKKIKKSRGMK